MFCVHRRRVAQLRNELRSIESLLVQKDEEKVEAVYAVTQEFKGKISELNKKLRLRSAADAEVRGYSSFH
jgi:hypothetical protein